MILNDFPMVQKALELLIKDNYPPDTAKVDTQAEVAEEHIAMFEYANEVFAALHGVQCKVFLTQEQLADAMLDGDEDSLDIACTGEAESCALILAMVCPDPVRRWAVHRLLDDVFDGPLGHIFIDEAVVFL